jgi:hypothetical protein
VDPGGVTDLTFTTNANTFYADNEAYYYVPDGSSTPTSVNRGDR